MATRKTSPQRNEGSPQKKAGAKGEVSITRVMEAALKRLQALGIEAKLQADIEWCLGSYRFDHNPAGLYEMAERAATVLASQRTANPKSVQAKLIKDLETIVKAR